MILSELDFQVMTSALRLAAEIKFKVAMKLEGKGDHRNARAEAEYSKHCAELADRYDKENPRAAERSRRMILPPGVKLGDT